MRGTVEVEGRFDGMFAMRSLEYPECDWRMKREEMKELEKRREVR